MRIMSEIEIYTQPWCPYCSRAVGLLTKKGVAFREIEAPHGSEARREAARRSGGWAPARIVRRNLGRYA